MHDYVALEQGQFVGCRRIHFDLCHFDRDVDVAIFGLNVKKIYFFFLILNFFKCNTYVRKKNNVMFCLISGQVLFSLEDMKCLVFLFLRYGDVEIRSVEFRQSTSNVFKFLWKVVS